MCNCTVFIAWIVVAADVSDEYSWVWILPAVNMVSGHSDGTANLILQHLHPAFKTLHCSTEGWGRGKRGAINCTFNFSTPHTVGCKLSKCASVSEHRRWNSGESEEDHSVFHEKAVVIAVYLLRQKEDGGGVLLVWNSLQHALHMCCSFKWIIRTLFKEITQKGPIQMQYTSSKLCGFRVGAMTPSTGERERTYWRLLLWYFRK